MRRASVRLLSAMIVSALAGSATWAQVGFPPIGDHLKCYKVKDPLKLQGVVNLSSPQFGLEQGCKVKKAVLFCVPVKKQVVQVTPNTPVALNGQPLIQDRICYKIVCPKPAQPLPDRGVIDQFGSRTISKFKPFLMCAPAVKAPIEHDVFPNTSAMVTVPPQTLCPSGDMITMSGPTAVDVHLGMLADTDGDGREQVPIEMIQLQLTGTTTCAGGQPVTLTLRDPSKHPNKRTVGEIEETSNTQTGRLDLPPFAPSGTADSFFDVFFEVQIGSPAILTLHNHTPKHMESTITHKPPNPGDMYQNPDVITLYNDNEQAVMTIGPAKHIPNPTTTTTSTSSTTSTTTPNTCAIGPGPGGPTCSGTCGAGTTCLNDPPQSGSCVCAPSSFVCSTPPQPFPTCTGGRCAGVQQQCRAGATACGCCGIPGAQCSVGSECCTGTCQLSQCQ